MNRIWGPAVEYRNIYVYSAGEISKNRIVCICLGMRSMERATDLYQGKQQEEKQP